MAISRVALVTAGASGIGRAIAEELHASGAQVHICDIDSQAIAACLSANPEITASELDVSRVQDVDTLFTEFSARYSQLDILVNNVGIAGPTAPVDKIDPEDWDETISVDLSAAFYVTRLATPLLRITRGTIVNMASNASLFGFPLRSPYTAAKWGLIGLTKTWAMELGPDGINVNAICPGSVQGPRIDSVIEKDAVERGVSAEEIRAIYERQSSMRAFVNSDEIAATVNFLCSPAAKKISGQALAIDGHTEGLSNWLS